jgi:hypothetical protein
VARRWRFTIVLTLALVAALWLWHRSHQVGDVLAFFVAGDGKAQLIASSKGRLCVALTNIGAGRERAWTVLWAYGPDIEEFGHNLDANKVNVHPPPSANSSTLTPFGDGRFGFSFATSHAGVLPELPDSKLTYITFPHWLAVAVILAIAVHHSFNPAARRRQRLAKGQCVHCGYDLRASPERCPECGAVAPARAAI